MGFDPKNLKKHLHEIVSPTDQESVPGVLQEDKPQKPPVRRWIKRIFVAAVAVVVLVFVAGVAAVWFLLQAPQADPTEQSFAIVQGEGIRDIASRLETEGLIRNAFAFRALLVFQGRETQVKAGDFLLSPAMAAFRISEVITAQAPPERDLTVTVPEGFDAAHIDARLMQEGFGEAGDFLSAVLSEAACAGFSAVEPCSRAPVNIQELEGYLFPDTYRFRKDATSQDIAVKMLANFERKLSEDLRDEIIQQKKSVHDIVIMASLIEKEVRTSRDMKMVSGVLWKRFEIAMPLQVDASVLYALEREGIEGKKTSSDLTTADLQFDSPHNTYKYAGLPAGPIANPGLAALVAAIEPEASSFLYYLSAPDGTTIFSRTLEEHNRAKARYLQ